MTPGNPQDPSTPAKPGESAPPAELAETAFVGPNTPANPPRPASGGATTQAHHAPLVGLLRRPTLRAGLSEFKYRTALPLEIPM